ncbi:hypothetical protein HELRODRAFT_174379 [Helobdella robusta]|uniref:Ig-like domain-containing protein n=1 Tax=Helobdella robusta TaxID=6412 RepID=T1F820_HELRO|nr:hypothetical protein HELRODRAFT_174379 [Helobdella robusta]ESO02914.1 hypothetical protein HELRODRAFT_174379 [Helobdella robusta]
MKRTNVKMKSEFNKQQHQQINIEQFQIKTSINEIIQNQQQQQRGWGVARWCWRIVRRRKGAVRESQCTWSVCRKKKMITWLSGGTRTNSPSTNSGFYRTQGTFPTRFIITQRIIYTCFYVIYKLQNFELLIEKSTLQDAGIFTCILSNNSTSVSRNFSVSIQS